MIMKRLALPLLLTVFALVASAQQPGPARSETSPRTPVHPTPGNITHFEPLNFRDAAKREAQNPPPRRDEIEEIPAPQPPPTIAKGVPIHGQAFPNVKTQSTPSFGTGISPGPAKTFKAEFLSSTSIPPDTMGAVGTTHVVTVTNDRMRIQTRDGIEISRLTLTSFWSGVTIKGAAVSAFDPKVLFDRFNNRFILISSGNGIGVNSGACFAVSATADPTGVWYRWSVAADPSSTGGSGGAGNWIDYPTVGHNKNWIVVDENVFKYTCTTTSPFPCSSGNLWGTQIYVLDKQAAYSNTLSSISLFADPVTNCVSPFDSILGCGFTMAPAITEDNTTDTEYLVEDWDSTAGQLRLSKITGTPAAPVITVGTQFPQSANSWRFNAARLSVSGGYIPQRQQSANAPSSQRIMANDSRVQNSVLRNGKLWCAHTIMVATTPTLAGTGFGAGNPDNHSGIQWWQIDPTNETLASTPPLQRGRIEDPTATNCHNGTAGTSAVAPCTGNTAFQVGEFFAFPNISVNQNEDVFIGFTRSSPITYPNSGYVIRRSTDAINTVRDPVIFRPGQANYNIGAGAGNTTARQNRWGDYSAAQTDPLNDTDFWTVQEYAGTVRDFGIGLAGNWETWWSQVRPTGTAPAAGTLIISELRLRGPQGIRDEFVELFNPGASPVIVATTDGSEGWALANSANGTTVANVFAVVPNGTVIAPRGHFLVADNPDAATGPTLVYSLNSAASTQARSADSDTGWSLDLADNGGIALFNTATTANFSASTRLDSVGFSTIAAGLFKEGNGIPAITAATPTGQMTFYRDLSNGTPKDTGANENDFIFANTVVGETLGSTPKLGAAGPENLGSPINQSGAPTLPAALVDGGVAATVVPNLLRDNTVVTNGAFGTISFRRTFTNNTGSPLARLRFRIVDITTNPAAGPAADLRALTSSDTTVALSGGGTASISGTALETPPTQAAGGGFNGTLTIPAVTLTTPLAAGGSVKLQFSAGVQVQGNYNFCLVPEGDTPTAAAPLCFTGATLNNPPSITPGGPLTRFNGESASATIATVSDTEDAAGSLIVTPTVIPAGITVTGIVNTSGTITATVAASCAAAAGPNNVTLQVVDSNGGVATATLVVNVTAPSTPTITPSGPTTFCAGSGVTLTSSAPSGNQWYLDGNPIGGETNQTYIATLSGSYTVVVTLFGCSSATSSATVVTVNPNPPTPTITPSGPTTFCTPGSVTLTSSSATGNQWNLNGNPIGGETNSSYVATASGSYTVTVTDGNGCSSTSAATVVTANPVPPQPTITPNGSVIACDSGTLTSSSATGNQWYYQGNLLSGETNQTLNVDNDGDYTVIVTLNGCSSPTSAATSVDAHVRPGPAFLTAAGPTTFCAGGSVTLQSNSATGIQWYLNGNPLPNPNNQNRTVSVGGTYTVTLNNQGCISGVSNSIVVTVNPLPATPTATPGGPTTFCAGGSVLLTSSSASGNQWFLNGNPIGGATNQTYSATASGSYTVKVTDGNGCTSAASAAVVVTVNPLPATPTITPGGPTTFCAGGSVTLSSSAGSGNQWLLNGSPIGGATNTTYVASLAGDYSVRTTNGNGCTSAASAVTTVTVNPNPNATITAPGSVNAGSTGNAASVANAGVGATYNWSITGGTITAGTGTANITFTAGGVGTLMLNVTVTTSAGCSDAKSANVNVTSSPITVTSVVPPAGKTTGGKPITVNGTGFQNGATITLGGSAATNVVFVNSTKLTAKTPAHAAGFVNVVVTNPDTGVGTLVNGYKYVTQQFDANGDTEIDPADIFYLVNYIYLAGAQPIGPAGLLSGDANGDDAVDPSDIFYIVNFLFMNGPAPASEPSRSVSNESVGEPMSGSVTLGEPFQRDGRTVIPVSVSSKPGSEVPQALSLRVVFTGSPVSDATIHRAGETRDMQPGFEISRRTPNSLSYLLSFEAWKGRLAGVVAEIELDARPNARLAVDVDPALTLLSNQGGTRRATVATGTLRVTGTSIGSQQPLQPKKNSE